mmetsp:Transcript_28423/g.46133  ORF Transcript_28423/g.46133 Transcript_28423/m.46133 type:complete len:359 (+) Transcript_28423:143-1219(+)
MTTATSSLFTLLLLSSCLCLQIDMAQSYVIDGCSTSIMSRFHNIRCKLFVTIDKTSPPPVTTTTSTTTDNNDENAVAAANYNENFSPIATGSKLGLPLDIQFTSSACTDFEMNNEPLLQGDSTNNNDPTTTTTTTAAVSPLFSLQPLNKPTFITHKGQQSVKITPGAYSCQLSDVSTQQYFFRFFLDFPEGASRNDVILPAERVYFMTACWMMMESDEKNTKKKNSVIDTARQWRDEFQMSLTALNIKIDELEQDDTVGLVERTRRFPHYMELLKQRQKLMGQIDMLEERFPLERPMVHGPNGTLLLKDGVVAVKRVFGGKTRYHWIGTFSFRDFCLDYGDDDDEMREKEQAIKKVMP